MTPRVLRTFRGQQVEVYSSATGTDDRPICLGTGYLRSVSGGALLLSEGPRTPICAAIEVEQVGGVWSKQRRLRLVGGKVYRMAEHGGGAGVSDAETSPPGA